MLQRASVFPGGLAIFEHDEAAFFKGGPLLVVGQCCGGNHGDSIVGGGDLTKVDFEVAVDQLGLLERVGSNNIFQQGGAVCV